jgi:Ring finger domain
MATDSESQRRKDKTFLGGECAVCEEQLELTLRGERILQLSCSHVAHEACFYEYLREFDSHACPICNAPLSLDSSRGGAVPNIGKYTEVCVVGAQSCRHPQQCRSTGCFIETRELRTKRTHTNAVG